MQLESLIPLLVAPFIHNLFHWFPICLATFTFWFAKRNSSAFWSRGSSIYSLGIVSWVCLSCAVNCLTWITIATCLIELGPGWLFISLHQEENQGDPIPAYSRFPLNIWGEEMLELQYNCKNASGGNHSIVWQLQLSLFLVLPFIIHRRTGIKFWFLTTRSWQKFAGEFNIPSESDSERLTHQSKWSLVIPLFIGIC